MRAVLVWAGLIVVAVGWYPLSCVFWPYAKCRRCNGRGQFRSPSGNAWRHCGRCSGTGGRLRIGRRIFNYFWNNRANR